MTAEEIPTQQLPSNTEAECILLGSCLTGNEWAPIAIQKLKPGEFFDVKNATIADKIIDIFNQGRVVSQVTVADALAGEITKSGSNLLDWVGGRRYLTEMILRVPDPPPVEHCAMEIKDAWKYRKLVEVGAQTMQLGYSRSGDTASDALSTAEHALLELADSYEVGEIASAEEIVDDVYAAILEVVEAGGGILGTPTGFRELDEVLLGLRPGQLILIGGRPASGKDLWVDTPIATPTGWTTMGQLSVGDQVFDETGEPCNVVFKSQLFTNNDCYRVTFDDGSSIIAGADHQWFTHNGRAWKSLREQTYRANKGPCAHPEFGTDQKHKMNLPSVVTTTEMANTLRQISLAGDDRPNHYIPMQEPLRLPEAELPIDPYAFGCWLGDGHSRGAYITTMDEEILDEFSKAGWLCEDTGWGGSGRAKTYKILTPDRKYDFSALLRDLGVRDDKHIPPIYLRASRDQRLALLQGIMDTDGHANSQGSMEIGLGNKRLIDDVKELLVSLGIKVSGPHEKITNFDTTAWRLVFSAPMPVFRMSRKLERQTVDFSQTNITRRRHVVSVEKIPTVPTQCIGVDSSSNLFLAGKTMVPTHNSSAAMSMAANIAIKYQLPALYFSLEMSKTELLQRVIAAEASVPVHKMRSGRLSENDWAAVSEADMKVRHAPLYVDDNPAATIVDIKSQAMQFKRKHGQLGIIVIDYLQLMSSTRGTYGPSENREQMISSISRNAKIMARELECPVVALSQLNRELERRPNKRPQLSDLRESGGLEQDADIVLFTYRDEMYYPDTADQGIAELIIAKHRAGESGTARLAFVNQFSRFENLASVVPVTRQVEAEF